MHSIVGACSGKIVYSMHLPPSLKNFWISTLIIYYAHPRNHCSHNIMYVANILLFPIVWGSVSWCAWLVPSWPRPRSLFLTRQQLLWILKLTTSFRRPSGAISVTALSSLLLIASTQSWTMTGQRYK